MVCAPWKCSSTYWREFTESVIVSRGIHRWIHSKIESNLKLALMSDLNAIRGKTYKTNVFHTV